MNKLLCCLLASSVLLVGCTDENSHENVVIDGAKVIEVDDNGRWDDNITFEYKDTKFTLKSSRTPVTNFFVLNNYYKITYSKNDYYIKEVDLKFNEDVVEKEQKSE